MVETVALTTCIKNGYEGFFEMFLPEIGKQQIFSAHSFRSV